MFWIGIVGSIIMGLISIVGGINADYGGGVTVVVGIAWIFFGPIVTRIYCELLIVIFSINETLMDVKNLLNSRITP